ncbi:hypothetical protein [Nonomuraea turcica]|uniref:hypothetical protein n=1 Tax=Nonomuraea sp. G32 TaxID=3067274 RepID=UPI00273C3B38|nr:hypothetical protein [Nonomuraea sp. G32]MDP4510252.1 hypothetical protein [Nonomuraea sp. G32]
MRGSRCPGTMAAPDDTGMVRLDEDEHLVVPPLSAEDVPAEAKALKTSWPRCCRSRRSPRC